MCVYDLTSGGGHGGGVTGERVFNPVTTDIFKNGLWAISAQCNLKPEQDCFVPKPNQTIQCGHNIEERS